MGALQYTVFSFALLFFEDCLIKSSISANIWSRLWVYSLTYKGWYGAFMLGKGYLNTNASTLSPLIAIMDIGWKNSLEDRVSAVAMSWREYIPQYL